MKFIIGILLLLVVLIILIDFIPKVSDFIERIHIGRYNDKNIWNKAITNIGVKWLNKTPKIKITDNTRLIAVDILKKNYSSSSIQSWQEASLILGLEEYLKNNNDENIKKEIENYLSQKIDEQGNWINKNQHVDSAILAYAILNLEFIDKNKYKKALDYTWKMIQEHIGEDGTVQYRKFMSKYRYVDTIGFICPFLICYGLYFDKEECIDLAVKQIKEYEKYGMPKDLMLPCHAYSLDNKEPLGIFGWGRGLGWYAIGLIDSYNSLPVGNKYKNLLEESVIKFAKTAIKYQQENGSWSWTVTRKESRPDSSATATLCWLLVNAMKIDDISKECKAAYDNGIKYLMSVTRRNGKVDFSQGDTKDIGVYSRLFDILPFTQGFCIRCINKDNN